jgi:hypothetical protein
MRTNNDGIARILLPFLTGAGCMVTLLVATHAITELTKPAPRIGDIISFLIAPGQPVEGGPRLTVLKSDRLACILDLDTLRHSGGSVVVESEVIQSPGHFRAHWAGVRTASDAGNCGASADLMLDTRELDILTSAAGGYGAGAIRTLALVGEVGI